MKTFKIGDVDHTFISPQERTAVRGLVITENNQLVLVTYRKYDFSVLPGGTVEADEDLETAFIREVLEETGYICHHIQPLCLVKDFRAEGNLIQYHYGFLARAELLTQPHLDTDEASDGLQTRLLPITTGIELILQQKVQTRQQELLAKRDQLILQTFLDGEHDFIR